MKKKNYQYTFFKYSVLTFLMMISAIKFNLFIKPFKIVSGGANGIAVVFNYLFGFDEAYTISVSLIAILLIGLAFKEYEIVGSAIYASIIYPFFVKLIGDSFSFIQISSNSMLVVVIFSGVITGVINGITCKLGISQGGPILISQILSKRIKINVSKLNTIINGSIVLLGGAVFGVQSILYAILFLISNRIVFNKVLLGISEKKLFQIITYEEDQVKDYIINELNASYTTFNAVGTSNENNTHKRKLIMSSVTNRDYFKLKEGIKQIDPRAFVLVTDSYEVEGGK